MLWVYTVYENFSTRILEYIFKMITDAPQQVLNESADPLLWPKTDNLMQVKIWKENQLLNWFTVSVELQRFFALNYSAFLSSSTSRRWLGKSPYQRPTHVRTILCFLANFQDSPLETSDELQYITKSPPKIRRSFTIYSAHPQKL